MIVKEFLLSLDFDMLCDSHYENYVINNEIIVGRAKENGVNLKQRDRDLISQFMEQLAMTTVEKTPHEYLMVLKYFDFDYTDDLDMIKTETYDAFILNKSECKKLPKFNYIKTIKDAKDNPSAWTSYSLMFQSWEKVLGLEIGYLPENQYAAACAIIEELTFFGYDKEENDARVKEETEKLDEISAEIEAGNIEYSELDMDLFRKDLGLPEESPEKKAKEQKLSHEIMVDNINESYCVYNLLLEQGFFDDCD